MLSLFCTCLFAQERTIRGVIVDGKTGDYLPGAIVSVKGKPSNVSSDKDGGFTIKLLPTDSILVFSYIGYKRLQVSVGAKSYITVKMDSTESADLNDVVVVGYGTQNQRDITGSVATVNLKQIADMPVASISDALKGQIPGLNVTGGSQRPGTLASLSVRQQFNWGKDGGGTIPLIVIDDVIQVDPQTGLPSLDRFNMLDLSEVESITVLRDASAAIYGSRASQGAIIIKTKRGKAGAPRISYNSSAVKSITVKNGKPAWNLTR